MTENYTPLEGVARADFNQESSKVEAVYLPRSPGADSVVVHVQPLPSQTIGSRFQQQKRPPTYSGLSVFTCLCCLWIFGLIAKDYSDKVVQYWEAGDYKKAKEASDQTLQMNIRGIIVGVMVYVIIVLLILFL